MPARLLTGLVIRRPLVSLAGVAVLLLVAALFLPRGPAVADSLVGHNPGHESPPSANQPIFDAMRLHSGELVNIHLDAGPGEPFITALTIAGEPYTLQAWPHSVRAGTFRVRVQTDDGSLVEVDPGLERTLRGRLLEAPGSKVAGSLLDTGLHAMILFADGSTRWIEPVAARVPGFDPSLHVVYGSGEMFDIDGVCGVTNEPIARQQIEPGDDAADEDDLEMAAATGGSSEGGVSGGSEGGAAGGLECVNLAIDADFQYYQKHNNSVSEVTDQVTLIVNAGNVQYENEIGVRHVITEIIVRTSSAANPYTTNNAGELLSEFRTTWNLQPEWSIVRDVAHLWTGRNLNGSTIGIAYIGRVCQKNAAYSLSQHITAPLAGKSDLFAHELGHNWDALHCSCPNHTMNASLTSANTFHPIYSIPDITAYKNGSKGWCTTLCEDPGNPGEPDPPGPLNDTCPNAQAAVAPGSYPFSTINATTTGPDETDRCNFNGFTQIDNDVWFLHQATCTGDLTVSLCGSDFNTRLAVYPAACPTEPGTALACNDEHCGTRSQVTLPVTTGQFMRIRIGGHNGAQGEGILHIECNVPTQPPDCPADIDGSGEVNIHDLLLVLVAWGPCAGCPEDITGSGEVDIHDVLQLLLAWGPCPE